MLQNISSARCKGGKANLCEDGSFSEFSIVYISAQKSNIKIGYKEVA